MWTASDQNKTTFAGDSGGPLVLKLEGQADLQIGVISLGHFGCGYNHSPGASVNFRTYENGFQEHFNQTAAQPASFVEADTPGFESIDI